jgi:two-component system, chemotaxis family, chemotaxis protein CheY
MSAALQMPVTPDDRAAQSPQLLVIDDDGTHRMLICLLARKLGYATTEAGSIEEAADLIASRNFDCMTLDLRLGAEHGTELLEIMHEKHPTVPVIVVSSADDEERWEVLRLATLYGMRITEMPKPLDLNRLRDVFIEISDIA